MTSIKSGDGFDIPPSSNVVPPKEEKQNFSIAPGSPRLSPDQEATVKEKLAEELPADLSNKPELKKSGSTDLSTVRPVSEKIQQKIGLINSSSVSEIKRTAKPDIHVGHLDKIKSQLEEKAPERRVIEAPNIDPGHLDKIKSKLGKKVPEHRLGANITDKQVDLHRNPMHADTREFTPKDFNDNALTNKYATAKLSGLIKEFSETNGRDPGPREIAKLREQATQWAYDTYMESNINLGLYNPAAMGLEIKIVLGVDDEIPANIKDLDSAMGAIKEELKKFNVPEFLEGRKQSQVLTNELYDHLVADTRETMEQYMKVFPDKSWEDAFVFCRDMARNAVYQVVFDKRTFTGSDHGVLHVHHNVENGDHMHHHMDEGDMSDKAKLLSRVMHFYHDIGYSVGAGKDFNVMKDHPFIGAAFIEANRDYFEHYMGKEETDILKKSILYHAIVSFDSKVGDDLAMVRFTTSNSDACAVAADQKTQSFWRENPETLLALARLKQFLIIYPEYGGRDKLSHSDIMSHPEKVLDSNNPFDAKALEVFTSVKAELLAIAQKQRLPKEEKEAFVQAIETNFNAFSGEVVLGQYGAELVDVSVVHSHEEQGPKYLPAVKMAPSILYSFLNSLYSTEVAGKNIQKVLMEEYYAPKEETTAALQKVGSREAKSAIVSSPVAHLELVEQTKSEESSGKLLSVIQTLRAQQQISVPLASRIAVNNLVKVINEMKDGKNPDFLTAVNNFYQVIGGTEVEDQIQTILDKFIKDYTEKKPMTKEDYTTYILDIRTQCTNDQEWKMIGLPSPLKSALE